MNNTDELIKVAAAAMKSYKEQGLPIEGGWESFKIVSVPKDAPQHQIEVMRVTFFAGAHHLFNIIASVISSEHEELTSSEVELLDAMETELKHFVTQVTGRRNKSQ